MDPAAGEASGRSVWRRNGLLRPDCAPAPSRPLPAAICVRASASSVSLPAPAVVGGGISA